MKVKAIHMISIACSLSAMILSVASLITINKIEQARKYEPSSNIITIERDEKGGAEFTIYDKHGALIDVYKTTKEGK